MSRRIVVMAVAVGVAFSSVTPTTAAIFRYLETQGSRTDCGPAALATLMRLRSVRATRHQVERELFAHGRSPSSFTTIGELEAVTAKFGPKDQQCQASTATPTIAQLVNRLRDTALIVRTCDPTPHYSVLLALDEQAAYIADPAIGNIAISRNAFVKRWALKNWINNAICMRDALGDSELGTDALAERGIATAIFSCGEPDGKRRHEIIDDIRLAVAGLQFRPFRRF